MPSDPQIPSGICTACSKVSYKQRCVGLQDGCEAEVEASLSPDKGVFYNIAVLLSGHRVQDAAALATCSGNPRLASIILQVSCLPY